MDDMDMKVAGTRKCFTAIQADLEIPATNVKPKKLDMMSEIIRDPRKFKKDYRPVTERLTIELNQRLQLIGPSGIDETNFTLFASSSQKAMNETKEIIENLLPH
uniref:Uncharacterized protein n=1 Tax=Glossina brevipalpis TaxID=37001 RepID=A0A1A9X4C1_9MUSC